MKLIIDWDKEKESMTFYVKDKNKKLNLTDFSKDEYKTIFEVFKGLTMRFYELSNNKQKVQ